MGSGIPSMSRFTLTGHGAQRYFDVYVGDYGAIQYRVVARLAEMDSDTSVTEADLSKLADAPRFIVDHILSLLESNGYVTLSARTLGGQLHGRHVFNRSPKLRRLLD